MNSVIPCLKRVYPLSGEPLFLPAALDSVIAEATGLVQTECGPSVTMEAITKAYDRLVLALGALVQRRFGVLPTTAKSTSNKGMATPLFCPY